ncbi:hypothetical protein CPB97_006117, partial [Podila verticillata]
MPLQNPTICVLGCGTMGIAIIRGTLDSNITTATDNNSSEDHLRPAGFIACVSHKESASKLAKTLGDQVKVLHGAEGNVQGVAEADVILL